MPISVWSSTFTIPLLKLLSSGSLGLPNAATVVLRKLQLCRPAELMRGPLKFGVFCALDYLFLEFVAEVAEIVAVTGHADYQAAMGFWLALRFP